MPRSHCSISNMSTKKIQIIEKNGAKMQRLAFVEKNEQRNGVYCTEELILLQWNLARYWCVTLFYRPVRLSRSLRYRLPFRWYFLFHLLLLWSGPRRLFSVIFLLLDERDKTEFTKNATGGHNETRDRNPMRIIRYYHSHTPARHKRTLVLLHNSMALACCKSCYSLIINGETTPEQG